MMKASKMITPIYAKFSDAIEYAAYDEGYEACELGSVAYAAPVTRVWLMAIVLWARVNIAAWRCGYAGHHFVSVAHDGENGYELIECQRCGLSHDCWH
jgi:hypothetical protein